MRDELKGQKDFTEYFPELNISKRNDYSEEYSNIQVLRICVGNQQYQVDEFIGKMYLNRVHMYDFISLYDTVEFSEFNKRIKKFLRNKSNDALDILDPAKAWAKFFKED